jgi:hypothetical protein
VRTDATTNKIYALIHRANRLRPGKVMNLSSRTLLGVVAVVAGMLSACGGNQATTQNGPMKSVHLSPAGSNYIGAESRVLTAFAIGVGNGKIAPGSRVAVSGGDNGVRAADQVWYGKTLHSANGFSLDYGATYTSQSGAQHVRGSGNLFVVSTTSVLSLTADVVGPGADQQFASARLQRVKDVAFSENAAPMFEVGSQTGGSVALSGNQLAYTDGHGNVAANYTYDASDDVANNVTQVMNANVPRPSTAEIQLACQGGAANADNTRIFSLSIAKQSASSTGGSHSTIIALLVSKHAQVDCATKQATTFVHFDVEGEIDGKGFLALSTSSPEPDTTAADSSPALPGLPLTTFVPDPADANVVGVPVSPDGQLPNFDGVYTGTDILSVSAPFAYGPTRTPIAFSVLGNTIKLKAPRSGSGSVDAGGGASFSFVETGENGQPVRVLFSGLITTSGGAKSASGTTHGVGPSGQVISGPWSATAPG